MSEMNVNWFIYFNLSPIHFFSDAINWRLTSAFWEGADDPSFQVQMQLDDCDQQLLPAATRAHSLAYSHTSIRRVW